MSNKIIYQDNLLLCEAGEKGVEEEDGKWWCGDVVEKGIGDGPGQSRVEGDGEEQGEGVGRDDGGGGCAHAE